MVFTMTPDTGKSRDKLGCFTKKTPQQDPGGKLCLSNFRPPKCY